MKHMMLDIETSGNLPGCKILSIGAVLFDKKGFYEEFYMRASYDSQLHLVDHQSTMDWWNTQDEEVFKEAFGGTDDLKDVLNKLIEFITRHNPSTIWCKGAAFDFAILNVALNSLGLKELPFKKLRCMRGLNDLLDIPEIWLKGNKHNALDDAKNQAINVGRCISKIDGWERI